MPQKSQIRRIGVVSQRLSSEESPFSGGSSDLLSRFLSSVDFSCPKPPSAWENNPLYKELKRSLQGTIQMAQVDEMLREKYNQASLMNSYPSQKSTATMSSAQSASMRDLENNPSYSTLDSTEEHMWWVKQTAQSRKDALHTHGDPPNAIASRKSMSSHDSSHDDHRRILKAKEGLEGLQGIWKLKWDEPVHLMDLCKLMECDVAEMQRRDEHTLLEVSII